MTRSLLLLVCLLCASTAQAAAPPSLTGQAEAILRTHCYRCHGQDGSVEGGLNYILDFPKLIARRKIVPGDPDKSTIFTRTHSGTMPPADIKERPSAAEIATLKRWISEGIDTKPKERPLIQEATLNDLVLADLETLDRRARRFVRYFSLAPLANAGAGPDELKTYRNALGKLLNSLSWHPRIALPVAIDANNLLLRIDLRDYLLDANSWNRLLVDYPYGVISDSGVSRAIMVFTGTRLPILRADWFVANASRAPLYYDLLQIPANLSELERQLRVDVEANIRQERIARAGFNGSGISRNNRILERHDAMNGAYWRTYDFEAVPQNLLERNILLPDRRNIFAYPLGPGGAETQFQHAGGEVIFNLPNGLHAYVLINASNQRINKGPTEIVSDPRRPDRAVEAGLSCMHCHARGMLQKDDQIRDHVKRNAKAFARIDRDLVEAFYVPTKKMRQLMDEDSQRFQKAVQKTGNKPEAAEVIMAMTLRYEADVDLVTLASEMGVSPEAIMSQLAASETIAKNLGALKVAGGTVSRQVVAQTFGELARALKLGIVLEVGKTGESVADATSEVDPLEAQSSVVNALAFSPDGKIAASVGADKSVRIFDIVNNRELRRGIGHTASAWAIAFSQDGTRVLSGSKDGTVRLWEVDTARELLKIDAHETFVSGVALSPDGKFAISAGYDGDVSLWELTKGDRVGSWKLPSGRKYPSCLAFLPSGKAVAVGVENAIHLLEVPTGKAIRSFAGHTGWISDLQFSADGKQLASASDDGSVRIWDVDSGKELHSLRGHVGPVRSARLHPSKQWLVSGGADTTVRLWHVASKTEIKAFRKHTESLVRVTFSPSGKLTLSASRDAIIEAWKVENLLQNEAKKEITLNPPPKEADFKELPRLSPEVTVPVQGTIGRMTLAPDGSMLWFINHTEGTPQRIDTKRGLRMRTPRLVEAASSLAMSPNGKILVGISPTRHADISSWLQQIDLATYRVSPEKKVPGVGVIDDVAVRNNGHVLLAKNTGVLEQIDLASHKPLGDLAIQSRERILMRLSADDRYLFLFSVQRGTAGLERIEFGDTTKSLTRKSSEAVPLDGDFELTPDGEYVVMRTGVVLTTNLEPHARIEPHLGATVDVAGKVMAVIARDGTLRTYSYPECKPLTRRRLAMAAYGVVFDAKAGKLWVAGFDPASVALDPKARSFGVIHGYSVK